jgi:hypothetical protein
VLITALKRGKGDRADGSNCHKGILLLLKLIKLKLSLSMVRKNH